MAWRGAYDGRHRAPRLWRPENTYRDGALLLGFVSGFALHAAHDAWTLEQPHWAAFFTAMVLADFGLYLHTCWLWFVCTGRAMHM